MPETNPTDLGTDVKTDVTNQEGQEAKPVEKIIDPFQSRYDVEVASRKKVEAERDRLTEQLALVENFDKIEKKAKDIDYRMAEISAREARLELISKEFPELADVRDYIPLGSVDSMREAANRLVTKIGGNPREEKTNLKPVASEASPGSRVPSQEESGRLDSKNLKTWIENIVGRKA